MTGSDARPAGAVDVVATPSAGQRAVPGLALLMVLLLAAGWLVAGVLVEDTPPLAVAAGRTGSAFLVITLVALIGRRSRADARRAGRRWRAVLALAFLGFFVYYVGTLVGVAAIGASGTNLVVSLLPCVTFAIGIMAFHERATWRKVTGTVLAVAAAGCYAIVAGRWAAAGTGVGDADVVVAGIGPAFLGTCAYALYGYVYRRQMSDVSPMAALPAVTGVAFAMLAPLVAVTTPLSRISPAQWLGIVVLGAVLTAPVFLVSHELIRRRGPLFTAAVALVVPLLVSLGEWGIGRSVAPGPISLALILVCCVGIWMTVAAPVSEPPVSERSTTT